MTPWRTGQRNLITDVAGLRVGNASSEALRSGVTVLVPDEPAVASCFVLGGAPGTRDTELLAPLNTVAAVDALVLSGGSAFGLDAASGVQSALRTAGRGFAVAGFRVPIVPAAILFDLANGGDKDWGLHPPYRELSLEAVDAICVDFPLGSVGAGHGATTAVVRGGLGSASAVLSDGSTVGALVAVNAVGSPLLCDSRHFWAAPFEIGAEFGGLGWPAASSAHAVPRTKLGASPGANTTIAIVATDAALTKAQAQRLAIAAHTGFARALWPSHTDMDGDLVFALSTARRPGSTDPGVSVELGAAAAAVMSRAIARGVHAARSLDRDRLPAWADLA